MADAAQLYYPTAFLLGALHSFEPAHGKTILVAYLVGGRRRLTDALLLSVVMTITHTFSILLLGAGAWFAAKELQISLTGPLMSLVGGLLVLGVGFWMLSRWRTGSCDHPGHGHHEEAGTARVDGRSLGQLVLLGIGGGIVPCPAGVAMLMTAVAAGDLAKGLGLASMFSLGVGAVVILLSLVIYRAASYTSRWTANSDFWTVRLPLMSSLVVIALGIWLSATAFLDYQNGVF